MSVCKGGDGLWVCALKSSGLRGQEYFKVQVGRTESENASLVFFLHLAKILARNTNSSPIDDAGKQGSQNLGQVLRSAGETQHKALDLGNQREI